MSEPFIGEIKMIGFNFAPRGFAFCDGQLLPISQNNALFSLLGTTYGGDGRTTFGLPDLRGRVPIHAGQGPGLTNRVFGSKSGREIEIKSGKPPIFGWGRVNVVGDTDSTGEPLSPGPYMPPHLTIRFVIALSGIFPSRH